MTTFCNNCFTVLGPNFSTNELTFDCPRCAQSFNSTPEDSMRFSEFRRNTYHSDFPPIKNGGFDPMNFKERRDCKSGCGGKFVRHVRIGDDMKLIYCCTECGYRWMA